MSKTYNKYINNEDHTWYDSSNIMYSVWHDCGGKSSLKIVFKGGRTYLYKNVEPIDYLMFRDAESNGQVFNVKIKNYETVKIQDTDLASLAELKHKFEDNDNMSEYNVNLEYNNSNGSVFVNVNGNRVFSGTEGQVSVMNLLRSMKIDFTVSETEETLKTIEDFNSKPVL